MDWTQWSAIAEIVGATAIVVSLVFVGLQIRSSTRATQGATFQDQMGYEMQLLTGVSTSEQALRAWTTSWDEADSTDDMNAEAKRTLAIAEMRLRESFYLQYKNGTMSEEGWKTREPLIRRRIQGPPEYILDDSFSGVFLEYVSGIRSDVSRR